MQLPGLGGERPQTDAAIAEQGRYHDIAQRVIAHAKWPAIAVGASAVYWGAAQYSESIPQFQSPAIAALGVGAAIAGAATIQEQNNTYRDHADLAIYPDPDQQEVANRIIRRQRAGALIGAGLVAATLGLSAFNAAKPYTEHSRQLVTSVTAVIDVGKASYTPDVTNSKTGELDMRILVGTNTILNSDDFFTQGSRISFVAAGTEVRGMGTVEVTTADSTKQDKEKIKSNFETQAPFLKTTDGKSALTEALKSNDVQTADKVVLVSSDVSKVPKSLFEGEAEPGINRISIVALGGATTTGAESTLNIAGNEALVGKEDTYIASSSDEMKDIINGIANTQFTETEQYPFEGYEKLRNFAAALFIGGYGASVVMSSIRRRINKRNA